MISRISQAGCALAVLLMLSGCSSNSGEQTAQLYAGPSGGLALACQTAECECLDRSGGIFAKPKRANVDWKEDGSAYCPAGYTLKRVETDVFGNKR